MADRHARSVVYQGLKKAASERIASDKAPFWLNLYRCVSTARVDLVRVTISGAGDKGLSLGEGSAPEIVDCVVTDSSTGVAIKDGSSPRATGLRIERCEIGVDSYSKNWRYPGGGRGHLTDCALLDNDVDARLDGSSTLVLERCSTGGRFVLPKGAPGEALSLIDPLPSEQP